MVWCLDEGQVQRCKNGEGICVRRPESCPTDCRCVPAPEARDLVGLHGWQQCPGADYYWVCGYDDDGTPLACVEPPQSEQTECPQGCFCLTKAEAEERGYTSVCQDKPCGYDADGNAKLCFKEPPKETECPTGCFCLTQVEAKRLGYSLCNRQQTQCGYDSSGNAKYCFEKPAEEAECPTGCFCLTQVEAKRLGYTLCQGQQTQCGYDSSGNAKYCFEKPAEDIRPGRITIDPAQDRNPVGTKHTITVTVYGTDGKPMLNVKVRINHTGAHSFNPIELTTGTDGRASYYYTGKNAGIDTIVATVDNLSATATKEWYIKPLTHR